MEGWHERNILRDDSPFKLFIDGASYGCTPHWHEEIEIIYIIKGNVRSGVNSGTYDMSEGDILLIGSGDIHYFSPLKEPGQRLVIQFGLSIFDDAVGGKNQSKKIRPVFSNTKKISSQWGSLVKKEIEDNISKLVYEYSSKDKGYLLAMKALLYNIVVLLLRHIPEDMDSNEISNHRDNLKRLEGIFDYVENNYSNPISLNDISKIAGFSTYHFTRFFKKNTGISFHKYLTDFRIAKVEWLLLNSDKSITQIADETGFLSIKTFNKDFKDKKNCSPTQYRKEQKIRSSEQ